MKTLQEYILEAMNKEEFLQKIHDIYNDDYESAFNVLTNYDKLIQSINNYDSNKPNDTLSLMKLFDKKLLLNNRNKLIIKNIYKEFNIDIINKFVELCFKEEKDIFNIEGKKSKILLNNEIFKFENEYENLKELFNYLIDIEYFSKQNNKAASGKFELLFILLYGKLKDANDKDGNDKDEDNLIGGDLQISDNIKIEIKSTGYKTKARLGTNVGKQSIEELSETFLKNIFEEEEDQTRIVNIFKDKKEQKNFDIIIKNFVQNNTTNSRIRTSDKPRCLGNETAYINIMTILNTFFNGKIKQSEEKDLCETIFKSYINVLLSQYGQKDTNDNVYNVLKDINPFYIADIDIDKYKDKEKNELSEIFKDKDKDKNKDKPKKFIYCKKLTQITGAIHLYGYALSKGFNHILIGDQSTSKCICITNVNTVEAIKNVLNNIIFEPAEVNSEKNSIKNNVSKIKDFIKK